MGYQQNRGPCAVRACSRRATAKGMCQAHYGRMRAAGDSLEAALGYPPVKERAPYGSNAGCTCEIPGCNDPCTKRGRCDRHYGQGRYRDVAETGTNQFVYLADAPGWTPPGVAKVGHGNGMRLKDFKTTLPTARLVRQQRVEFPARTEALLHHMLAGRRVAGEWFRVTPEEFDAALRLALKFAPMLDPMRYDVGRQARALGVPQIR